MNQQAQTKHTPDFSVSAKDSQLLMLVFQRAITAGLIRGPRLSAHMDLTAAHTSCGLRLSDLLEAEPFDFAHDVCGIFANINRRTGQLDNCFLPRYAKREEVAA